jgi:hypothetical protein
MPDHREDDFMDHCCLLVYVLAGVLIELGNAHTASCLNLTLGALLVDVVWQTCVGVRHDQSTIKQRCYSMTCCT